MRQRCRVGADPYAAHDNIIAAAAYLGELRDGYDVSRVPRSLQRKASAPEDHLAFGRPLLMETHAYLAPVAPVASCNARDDAVSLASIDRSWTGASLIVTPSGGSLIGARLSPKATVAASDDGDQLEDLTGLVPKSDGLFGRAAVAPSDGAPEGYGRESRVSEGRHNRPHP